jgi:hypothetical protein
MENRTLFGCRRFGRDQGRDARGLREYFDMTQELYQNEPSSVTLELPLNLQYMR